MCPFFMLYLILLFGVKTILSPFLWVGVNIIPNFKIVLFSTNYMVVERTLEDVIPYFAVNKPF